MWGNVLKVLILILRDSPAPLLLLVRYSHQLDNLCPPTQRYTAQPLVGSQPNLSCDWLLLVTASSSLKRANLRDVSLTQTDEQRLPLPAGVCIAAYLLQRKINSRKYTMFKFWKLCFSQMHIWYVKTMKNTNKQACWQTGFSNPSGKLTSHVSVSPKHEVKYIYSTDSNYD